MNPEETVSQWIDQLKAGEANAAQPLWERYFEKMVRLAQRKLQGAPRAVADEEDVALSAFKSFCMRAEQGRFPQLADRDDLWKLLVVLTERKAANQWRDQRRLRRGGGKVVGENVLAGSGDDGSGGGFTGVPGSEPTPLFAAMVAEECRILLDALEDDTLRRIATRKMEGFTNDEIAAELQIAVRSVERKLALIRQLWESAEK